MDKVKYGFVAFVFDKFDEYARVINDQARLAKVAKKIIDGVYSDEKNERDVIMAECQVGDYYHFRYYIILCYDCCREEKLNKNACVENPVASCAVIEVLSEEEDGNIDKVRVVARYDEPPGRAWLDLNLIAGKAAARVFNRLAVLVEKRVCF